jgi:hypothetical protein
MKYPSRLKAKSKYFWTNKNANYHFPSVLNLRKF